LNYQGASQQNVGRPLQIGWWRWAERWWGKPEGTCLGGPLQQAGVRTRDVEQKAKAMGSDVAMVRSKR